jgi:glycosyltransferase involved in cell wall biosynthesis
MASGLPVVATRVGGLAEVVRQGETGLLVEPGDVRGIERALVELASDPARRVRMGEEGRRRVLQTSGEATVAAGWRTVYDRLEASV